MVSMVSCFELFHV